MTVDPLKGSPAWRIAEIDMTRNKTRFYSTRILEVVVNSMLYAQVVCVSMG